jgi:hypothetical protein
MSLKLERKNNRRVGKCYIMKSPKNSRRQPLMSLKFVDLTQDWYGIKELEILKENKILEICALLGFYAADSGNSLTTFGVNLSARFSKVNKSKLISEFGEFLDP